jgi:hypothetical protein
MVQQFTSATHNEASEFNVRTTADTPIMQSTKLGYEIPIPSKSQIERDFLKVALAKHDTKDDE